MHLLPDPGFGRGSIATDARLLRFGSAEAGETSLGSSRSTCSWVRPSPEDWRFRDFAHARRTAAIRVECARRSSAVSMQLIQTARDDARTGFAAQGVRAQR